MRLPSSPMPGKRQRWQPVEGAVVLSKESSPQRCKGAEQNVKTVACNVFTAHPEGVEGLDNPPGKPGLLRLCGLIAFSS